MAGWNCVDAEVIEWDGTIRVTNQLHVKNRIGVGTNSPSFPVDVIGVIRSRTDAGGTSGFYATQANPVDTLIIDNNASGSARIVTNAAVPITIGTNLSTTQLFLQSGGKIGIGTTTPDSLFELTVAGAEGASAGIALWADEGDDNADKWAIYAGADGNLYFADKSTGSYVADITISGAVGYVGIGTTNPWGNLQVAGTSTSRIILSDSVVDYNTDSPKLSFFGYSPDASKITGASIQKITTSGGFGRGRLSIFQHDANDYTTETEVVTILPNGNVGIGTNTPAQKVHVSGAIAFNTMVEPTLGICSGALFVSGAILYYKNGTATYSVNVTAI